MADQMHASLGELDLIIDKADSFIARFLGLMGRRGLPPSHGLLFEKCSSVHMFFMRFPLDIVYFDNSFRVLYVETLAPWQLGSFVRGCVHVLELNAGELLPNWRPGETFRLDG